MKKYSAIFVLFFHLFFSFPIFGEEPTDFENNNTNIENINIIETNQQDNDTNADEFIIKRDKTSDKPNLDLSKKFTLFDEIQEPFKEVIEEENNKNLTAIEGKIEENTILSLDDCIKRALANNPKIKTASFDIEASKTKITQAWANYFPIFTMTNGLTRNRYFTINFTVEDKLYTFYNTIDLSATQLVFDFGKTNALAKIAKYNFNSSIANFDGVADDIIYATTNAYYNLIYTQQKKEVYEDTVTNYNLQLEQAQMFYKTGKKSKIDILTAQYNLENAKLNLTECENDIKLAKAELSNLMGAPEYENYEVTEKLKLKDYEYIFEELLEEAYANNSELKIYKNQIKTSQQNILSAKRAFTPNLEVFGRFQDGGGTSLSDDYGWTIGVQLKCNNFNLLLMKKQLDEAKANYKRDLAELEEKKNNLYLDVKQAYIKMKNAENSIPIASLSLKRATEQHRLAQGRYKAGAGDAIELKDAQTSFQNARLEYLNKILQYNLASVELEKITGKKLEEKTNDEISPQVIEIIE